MSRIPQPIALPPPPPKFSFGGPQTRSRTPSPLPTRQVPPPVLLPSSLPQVEEEGRTTCDPHSPWSPVDLSVPFTPPPPPAFEPPIFYAPPPPLPASLNNTATRMRGPVARPPPPASPLPPARRQVTSVDDDDAITIPWEAIWGWILWFYHLFLYVCRHPQQWRSWSIKVLTYGCVGVILLFLIRSLVTPSQSKKGKSVEQPKVVSPVVPLPLLPCQAWNLATLYLSPSNVVCLEWNSDTLSTPWMCRCGDDVPSSLSPDLLVCSTATIQWLRKNVITKKEDVEEVEITPSPPLEAEEAKEDLPLAPLTIFELQELTDYDFLTRGSKIVTSSPSFSRILNLNDHAFECARRFFGALSSVHPDLSSLTNYQWLLLRYVESFDFSS